MDGRDGGPLLLDDADWRMSLHQLARIVKRLARRTGLNTEPSPHPLRHAAAMALDAGAVLRDV